MKVGVSSWFGNLTEYEERHRIGAFEKPYPISDAAQIRRELAIADLVEPLGFDSFWTIEHHFTPYGMTNNPTQLLTYVAGRTSRIDLGTMVLVIPWHEPLKLAENIALLDVLLDGRKLNIGCGRGFAAREYRALNIPYEDSRTRMQECLDIVSTALTTEFFSHEGKHWKIPRTAIRPRPIHPDLTPNMLMTWASPESLEMAAHSGYAPLFTNYKGWDVLERELKRFDEIRESHGWERSTSAIAVTTFVHEDGDYAREQGQKYWRKTSSMTRWHYDREGSAYFMPNATAEEREAVVRAGIEEQASAGIFGTPSEVIEQIAELARKANIGHLMCLQSFGDMPLEMTERSMRLFAKHVLPIIKNFGGPEPKATPYERVKRDRAAAPASSLLRPATNTSASR
ncbi:MAG TPA: LLM class flavin-dependent oxidoreductase [Polyangiales bacterium]|nr:LLM class flavin-dependent oxidoreductase [Polyangiales bacterium]